MAKNFVEEGKTVAIVASAAISSGELVQVGDVFAVALTDIPQGETGDGLTEGVFMLPKLKTDDMKTGKKVYLKSGKVQLTNSGSDPLVGVEPTYTNPPGRTGTPSGTVWRQRHVF